MGNKQAGSRVANGDGMGTSAILADGRNEQEGLWEEQVEVHQCCGVSMEKVRRSTPVNTKNASIGKTYSSRIEFTWATRMIELVRNYQLPKSSYFAEVAALKREAEVEAPTTTELLTTPAELTNFKDNMKRSVILSVAASKISSVNAPQIASMIGPPLRSRIAIERSFHLNSEYRNSQLKFERAKSLSSKGSLCRSIISLIDDTISSVMGADREISKQAARDIELFLKFSMILQRHLGDSDCILARIRQVFLQHFQEAYQDAQKTSLRAGDFVDDVKQYLVLQREAVFDYYNLASFAEFHPGNIFIANDDNVLSACTAILFKNPSFYSQAFAVACSYCKARQDKLDLILDRLHDSPPEMFQVNERFCLGAKTIKACLGSMNGSEGSRAESGQLKDFVVENEKPYQGCMDQLRQLQKSKSPIGKMKIIVGCAEGISAAIEHFYKRNGLKREKWVLDADQVLAIFCYIIVGARVPHLLVHLFLLENFATSHQMISVSGYYVSVVGGAVDHLETKLDASAESDLL